MPACAPSASPVSVQSVVPETAFFKRAVRAKYSDIDEADQLRKLALELDRNDYGRYLLDLLEPAQ